MAEGFAQRLSGVDENSVFARVESAALEHTSSVNPDAIEAMATVGIDITRQYSKMLDDFSADDFTIVISMCGCGATVPDVWKFGKRFEDWNVPDPTGGSKQDFETARNEIQSRVQELASSIKEKRSPTYSLYEADACPLLRPANLS
jgi:arsenate reductase